MLYEDHIKFIHLLYEWKHKRAGNPFFPSYDRESGLGLFNQISVSLHIQMFYPKVIKLWKRRVNIWGYSKSVN